MMRPSRQNIIGIVGLGYVGLSLVKSLFERNFIVIGYDTDENKVEKIRRGHSPNETIEDSELVVINSSGRFYTTTEAKELAKAEVVIVAVPTPLTAMGNPDLSLLERACVEIAPHIKSETLLINESTSYPGTLRDFIVPLIKQNQGDGNSKIYFACSPERVNPGDVFYSHGKTPRVVSGLDDSARERVHAFYSEFVDDVFVASTPEVAEMSKLLENSFRLVNISFINEISDYCVSQGIPVREVIQAASTKPFGFMPFLPGPGVGGHCIPVDPAYLLQDAADKGKALPLLKKALQSNRSRSSQITSFLKTELGSLKGKKVLIEGVTYKPNVADTRETPAEPLFESLMAEGAQVHWHDSLVQNWNNSESSRVSDNKWEITLVLVLHEDSDVSELIRHSEIIFDFTGKLPMESGRVRLI
ncbi:MAG: nucleotide sugar dehydrogenase [Actinobacteria bacterium]|nr:nucleotide sugar dehydrogenase [Actinomycetota bacterium]